MIETRSLSVHLTETPILHDVTVKMPLGKMTALVGPNGAGKSTLLSAMGRLITPEHGEVLLDGKPLAAYCPKVLAKHLAILRQDSQITPRLTVRDLVGFGRYPHSHGRPGPKDSEAIDAAIARLDLKDFADRFLDTLSGGQRQRALIAMVLAQDTDVILLDEPLNNLDIVHARTVMRVAREEADKGKTVVVVLHDLSVAAAHAEHVVALKAGRLHSEGVPEVVLTRDNLSDLYDTEVQVIEAEGRRIVLTV
ncbi:MAG: ATP-binding cassette domain-containing protein [Rhodobacteraceae bacterium]|nr:MAG: ATP-binding cassette domain-containing protein [Paracoccaceae bacterium]